MNCNLHALTMIFSVYVNNNAYKIKNKLFLKVNFIFKRIFSS